MFPAVGGGPGCIALRGQWPRRRTQAQHVQQQRLVVAFPAVAQEAAFGRPAVRDRAAPVLSPLPIRTAVQRVGQGAQFLFVGTAGVEVHRRRERAGQQEGGVDGGQLALPGAAPAAHVEKVVVEALVSGGVGLWAVRAVPEESQRRQRAQGRCAARHEAAFDGDGVAGKGQAGGGNAGRPVRRVLVEHQAVGGIRFMQEVAERLALQIFQPGVGAGGHPCRHGVRGAWCVHTMAVQTGTRAVTLICASPWALWFAFFADVTVGALQCAVCATANAVTRVSPSTASRWVR